MSMSTDINFFRLVNFLFFRLKKHVLYNFENSQFKKKNEKLLLISRKNLIKFKTLTQRRIKQHFTWGN